MLTIARLFGKSPFSPLKSHMQKVTCCVDELTSLYKALEKNDEEEVLKCKKHISKLEHEADLTKNDIRNHLPKSLFLPIDRSQLLEILSLQDALSDKAEDIATTVTLGKLENFSKYQKFLKEILEKNIAVFHLIKQVVLDLDELLESSFGGIEAEKVKSMIESIAYQEHQLDILQYDFLRNLYQTGHDLPATSFYLWISLVKEIGEISNLSEKLGNRIRMILEVK